MSGDNLDIHALDALSDNALLNSAQAAKLLGVSTATFSRLLRDGLLDESRVFLASQTARFWKGRMLATVAARTGRQKGSTKPAQAVAKPVATQRA